MVASALQLRHWAQRYIVGEGRPTLFPFTLVGLLLGGRQSAVQEADLGETRGGCWAIVDDQESTQSLPELYLKVLEDLGSNGVHETQEPLEDFSQTGSLTTSDDVFNDDGGWENQVPSSGKLVVGTGKAAKQSVAQPSTSLGTTLENTMVTMCSVGDVSEDEML
ncbi:hypothetical protein NDU88_004499 [Pleurodeles waltl]|uniref:Uncharacterized protein n=1 Tax=Pleurodeles waltl TaxID=8319 RepID=A0AAV7VK67_PLEWA|nr:hypothetical protein NDU88_004499 [Pleurodeles waltl]